MELGIESNAQVGSKIGIASPLVLHDSISTHVAVVHAFSHGGGPLVALVLEFLHAPIADE